MKGNCLSGAVEYEINQLDAAIGRCHCRTSRKADGAEIGDRHVSLSVAKLDADPGTWPSQRLDLARYPLVFIPELAAVSGVATRRPTEDLRPD